MSWDGGSGYKTYVFKESTDELDDIETNEYLVLSTTKLGPYIGLCLRWQSDC